MDKLLILNKIKSHCKIKTDAEFARFLDISTQNMYTWVKRGTYDPRIILAKCPEISAEWLLSGEGDMLKSGAKSDPVVPPPVSAPDAITIPASVWDVISNQAASLKAKDEQMNKVIAGLTEKDEANKMLVETNRTLVERLEKKIDEKGDHVGNVKGAVG